MAVGIGFENSSDAFKALIATTSPMIANSR
jgi:hypothetical protein